MFPFSIERRWRPSTLHGARNPGSVGDQPSDARVQEFPCGEARPGAAQT